MTFRSSYLGILAAVVGALLIGVFALVLARFRATLRDEVRQTIIDRDAAVRSRVNSPPWINGSHDSPTRRSASVPC